MRAMRFLTFDKPEKLRPTELHNEMHSSDTGIPGTYVPNMSDQDRKRFKARRVKGEVPRIEVRVSMNSEILVKVKARPIDTTGLPWNHPTARLANEHGPTNIKISMNGPAYMTYEQWEAFKGAIDEAISLVKEEL